tara:strand:+ start:531 stop:704 length:174 start_codon:yes stop_codon:yes gene_type:complete
MSYYKHSKELLDNAVASVILDLRHEPQALKDLLLYVPKTVLEDYTIPADKIELENES